MYEIRKYILVSTFKNYIMRWLYINKVKGIPLPLQMWTNLGNSVTSLHLGPCLHHKMCMLPKIMLEQSPHRLNKRIRLRAVHGKIPKVGGCTKRGDATDNVGPESWRTLKIVNCLFSWAWKQMSSVVIIKFDMIHTWYTMCIRLAAPICSKMIF